MLAAIDAQELAIQRANFRQYSDAMREPLAPWIDAKPPIPCAFFMNQFMKPRKVEGRLMDEALEMARMMLKSPPPAPAAYQEGAASRGRRGLVAGHNF